MGTDKLTGKVLERAYDKVTSVCRWHGDRPAKVAARVADHHDHGPYYHRYVADPVWDALGGIGKVDRSKAGQEYAGVVFPPARPPAELAVAA